MTPFLILSPSHRLDRRVALAAIRTGETGILDLGWAAADSADDIRTLASTGGSWGLRIDTLAGSIPAINLEQVLGPVRAPVLVLGDLPDDLSSYRTHAASILVEVCSAAEALAAQVLGVDGVILKGHEAYGRVSADSTFLFLQRLRGKLTIPYWVAGGIGPDTAAAAFLAGARGVVLREQLGLVEEAHSTEGERNTWASLDGSETICLDVGDQRVRLYARNGPKTIEEYTQHVAQGGDPHTWLRDRLKASPAVGPEAWAVLGQDIGLSHHLGTKHHTVAGVIAVCRKSAEQNRTLACRDKALAPGGPLAKVNGIEYPIFQGPMTRVSDVAALTEAVAGDGGMPFLALALLTGSESRILLEETKSRLGDRHWGVGILGFVPNELRKAQLAEVLKVKPSHAIIAGGRPSQAKQLEDVGISTYLHVPSPGLLKSFLRDGARKFIFEGRECGGHVGPRGSFLLWQSIIDVLLEEPFEKPEDIHVVFAGGIHDAASAAMVATLAARLSARGIKIGVLMGTAYLFTHEAVSSGAITEEFQRRAVACGETVLLESGIGHATRCIPSPFAEEFQAAKMDLHREGIAGDEIRFRLEMLNVGRLRAASKGVIRQSDPMKPDAAKAPLVNLESGDQWKQGLYMIGQVASLRDGVISMAALHADVSKGGVDHLLNAAKTPLPWAKPKQPIRDGDIAVVGMACLFPKAGDLRKYWENMVNGLDAVEEVPADRWSTDDYFHPDRLTKDRVYSKWGSFLGGITFDPVKWRIPPASLKAIEPLQLLSLEIASRAMADAGYDRRDFAREKAGVVFAAAGSHEMGTSLCVRTMMNHYLSNADIDDETRQHVVAEMEKSLPDWTEDSFPGFLINVISGRIARELNLNGPNFAVDAACAAALAAVHLAVETLRTGTSDVMLVGAADGSNNPFTYMSFAKTHALSPSGRSRPFDDSADGIALGEGIGCVVLKRLEDAERDGDKIYAVLRGIGCSSDGKHRSLTAPHPPGQMRAVRRAWEDAGIDPLSITMIEAHGTGTAVGDASELTTLNDVYAETGTPKKQFVAVGSIKSMIGHTKTVAGIASFIKAVLALQHRVLPPTLHVKKPTRRIDFPNSPFYINSETRPWLVDDPSQPRRAGVSAFGFGGTNFHIVLEERMPTDAAPELPANLTPRSAELFLWRRATRAELARDLAELREKLDATPLERLAPLANALYRDDCRRPRTNAVRLAIVASNPVELRERLAKAITDLERGGGIIDPAGLFLSDAPPVDPSRVCFLFPGQGSASINMMRDLAIGSPWADELFAEADAALAEFLPLPVSRYIFPIPVFNDDDRKAQVSALTDTCVNQPALAAVELFGMELLERFGLRPAVTAGHSFGEYIALHAAGSLDRAHVLRLAGRRGAACAEAARQSPGGMAVVRASAQDTDKHLKELGVVDVSLANLNSPEQTIIAGPNEALDAAIRALSGKGVGARRIPVTAPFHTRHLRGAAEAMADAFRDAEFKAPVLPVYANITGKRHESPESIRDLLSRHFTEPVQFEKEVRQLYADGARVFIEVGPGTVLTNLVKTTLKAEPVTVLSLDGGGRPSWTQLGHLLGQAFVLGLPVDAAAWFDGRGLPDVEVMAHLDRVTRESKPKPTDWILSPLKATPITPMPAPLPSPMKAAPQSPGRGAASPADRAVPKSAPAPARAPSPVVPNPVPAAPVAASVPTTPAPKPVAPAVATAAPAAVVAPNPMPAQRAMPAANSVPSETKPMSQAEMNGTPLEALRPSAHPGLDAFAQFQATTRQFLELQHGQQRVVERFLETQERMLAYCLGGVSTPMPMLPAPMPAAIAAPPIAVAPVAHAPVAHAPAMHAPAAPAPVKAQPVVLVPAGAPAHRAPLELGRAAEPAKANGSHTNGSHTPGSSNGSAALAPTPAAAPAAATAIVAVDGEAPPTEMFRVELLQVVSQRTGYPVDMLDETLPLEAGLGIDSIKTVEIFSNLKRYHVYFQQEGQDEEELLAEFTRLKTLKDVIDSYDRRRGGLPLVVGKTVKAIEVKAEIASSGRENDRFAVQSVEAPAGEKKKTSRDRSPSF